MLRLVPTPLQATLRWPAERRGGLDSRLAAAFVAAPGTEPLLTRAMAADTLAVTTGQQPGLLTGPLYTIYKALSAAALARLLERRWGRPVVPIFWAAGDDHDFAEGNHATWLGADGSPVTATLRERPADAPLTPLAREPVGAEILPMLERLAADLGQSEFALGTVEWLRRHYTPDATLGGAFAGALAELLAPHGVLVFDATHPAAKRAQAPLLLSALRQQDRLQEVLVARAGALAAEGRDPGVTVGDEATLVMLEASKGRDRLVVRSPGFAARRAGEAFSLADVERIAETAPERLSPNVLLRPVVESALLPTVAYVAGPGELGYLGLAESLYPALEVPRQAPLPRWSGVLVEPRVERVLEKYHLTLADLLEAGPALEARLARETLPAAAVAALEHLRAEIARGYETLATVARDIDPTIEKPVRNLGQAALTGAQDAEKRLIHHLKKRRETEFAQVQRARQAVRPDGRPQERVLTLASPLGRAGPALLTALGEEAERWYAAGLEAAPAPA